MTASLREAATMALKELVILKKIVHADRDTEAAAKFDSVIEPLRAALALPDAEPVESTAQQMREYAEARVLADRTVRQVEQGSLAWMQNIEAAMKEPLFHELRGVMGTENIGQDIALLQTLRRYRAKAPPAPVERKPLTDEEIDRALKHCEKIVPDFAGWVRLQRRAYARAVEAAHNIKGAA